MSDELDLSPLRGKGLQAGEVELPEGDGPPAPGKPNWFFLSAPIDAR